MKKLIFASIASIVALLAVACSDPVSVEPSPTAVETPTSTPIPDPTECPTSEERAWFMETREFTDAIDEAYGNIGNLLERPRVGNSDWINDLAWEMAILSTNSDKLIAFESPPTARARAVHDKLIGMAEQNNASIEDLVRGIDDDDPDYLEKGSDHISRAGDYISEATELIREFCQ